MPLSCRPSPGRPAWSLLLFFGLLGPASTAGAEGDPVALGGLRVQVTETRELDCGKFLRRAKQGEESLDLCFSAAPSAAPELVVETEATELLHSVSVEIIALGESKHTSTSKSVQKEPRRVFRQRLSLPGVPRGGPGPSPDAPLLEGKRCSLFDPVRERGFSKPGFYRVTATLGAGETSDEVTLGVEVRSKGGGSDTRQWILAGGAVRLLTPGCARRQPDPVVELFLEDCEDPRYRIKAVTAKRAEGVTLASYVDSSLAAYQRIWHLESRAEGDGEPSFVKLELQQILAGEHSFLLKYFVDLGEDVMVVTFYGPPGEERTLRRRYGDLKGWLLLAEK